jgi:uncharacterized protein YjcR
MTKATFGQFKVFWKDNVEQPLFRIAKEEGLYKLLRQKLLKESNGKESILDGLEESFNRTMTSFNNHQEKYVTFEEYGVNRIMQCKKAMSNLPIISEMVIFRLFSDFCTDDYITKIIKHIDKALHKKNFKLWIVEELKSLLKSITQ